MLKVVLFLVLMLTLISSRLKSENMIQIRLVENNDKVAIKLYHSLGDTTYNTTLNYNELKRNFTYLFNCLKLKQEPDKSIINYLSSIIIYPITDKINSSNWINFVIDNSQISFPLDLLIANNLPLFLSKEISYSFYPLTEYRSDNYINAQGLILRDETTDPQNACGYVDSLFTKSEFYLPKDFNFELLKTKMDFLLVSAHGSILNDEGQIQLTNKFLTAKSLQDSKFDLVYFDSCDQGISKSFIDTLTINNSSFYIAPIIKNEAGNSSTFTIKSFFKHLKQGKSITASLYLTKVELFEIFKSSEDGLLYWYVFPMRVYKL